MKLRTIFTSFLAECTARARATSALISTPNFSGPVLHTIHHSFRMEVVRHRHGSTFPKRANSNRRTKEMERTCPPCGRTTHFPHGRTRLNSNGFPLTRIFLPAFDLPTPPSPQNDLCPISSLNYLSAPKSAFANWSLSPR